MYVHVYSVYIHISYCSLDTGPVVIETMWANYPLTSPTICSIQYMYIYSSTTTYVHVACSTARYVHAVCSTATCVWVYDTVHKCGYMIQYTSVGI